LEYSFENFTNLGKKKNGKVQNRTLPSSIEMSYKVKILRQTGCGRQVLRLLIVDILLF